jgi:hypothetical protein
MSGHKYTPEEIQFIKDNIDGRSYAELAELFNRKFNLSVEIKSIQNLSNRHNLKTNKIHFYTPEETEFIKNNIGGRPYKELAELFNRKFNLSVNVTSIKNHSRGCNLSNNSRYYTPERIQFLKDNIDGRSYAELAELFNRKFNLSVKEYQLKSVAVYYKLKNGLPRKFYPGHLFTRLPIGTEAIDKSNGYVKVKTAHPSVWKKSMYLFGKPQTGRFPRAMQ